MKILTVCQRGNCRSVSLGYYLKDWKGYDDVIACGIQTTKPETFAMLANWADKILVPTERAVWEMIPEEFRKKGVHIDIGNDRWGNPMNPELLQLMAKIVEDLKL